MAISIGTYEAIYRGVVLEDDYHIVSEAVVFAVTVIFFP